MSPKWPKMSRLHPFGAFSNTHTEKQKLLSKAWCREMLNIWWEERSAYQRSRSRRYEMMQVQAAALSRTSNSLVREVAPHLYRRKWRKEFVTLFPATTREWKYQLKATCTGIKNTHSPHMHRKAYAQRQKLTAIFISTCRADFEITLTSPKTDEPPQPGQVMTLKSSRLHLTKVQCGSLQKAGTGSWGTAASPFFLIASTSHTSRTEGQRGE